jgi:oligopeptide transport system ATP-binding protein
MNEQTKSPEALPDDTRLLSIRDVFKQFPTKGRPLRAVDGVSFDVHHGETLSLVGESGCGKTTTGQIIVGLQNATSGSILYEGKPARTDTRAFRKRVQIVFQNPYSSLDPHMRIKEILREPLRIHGVNRSEHDAIIEELLDMAHLNPSLLDRFPFQLSGGQRQRVAIARALALRPEFIVLDEPVSALDVSVQAQIVNLLRRLQDERKLTYLFISHDLRVVTHISDRVAVMYLGRIVEIGSAQKVMSEPQHPYTQALISAVPQVDPAARGGRIVLQGELPSPTDVQKGCRFAGRCPKVMEICRRVEPELKSSAPGSAVACHLF